MSCTKLQYTGLGSAFVTTLTSHMYPYKVGGISTVSFLVIRRFSALGASMSRLENSAALDRSSDDRKSAVARTRRMRGMFEL